MISFEEFEVITFDCYGTLIDWETGIVSAARSILTAHGINRTDEEILEMFAAFESRIEAGPYLPYRAVLQNVIEEFGNNLGFVPARAEVEQFALSIQHWPPFLDSTYALESLQKRYRLAIISNVDDDLFAFSEQHLHITFDWIVTAQQVGSYKPSLKNFTYAIEHMGIPEEKILHVAQSLFHDIAPAKKMGLTTVWINRRHNKEGFGATPPAEAMPDFEVPDLMTLAALIDK